MKKREGEEGGGKKVAEKVMGEGGSRQTTTNQNV